MISARTNGHPVIRLCDECSGITTIRQPGYSTLIKATGITLHFCSGACLQTYVKFPDYFEVARRWRTIAVLAVSAVVLLTIVNIITH